jgi:cytochrome c peroxidase
VDKASDKQILDAIAKLVGTYVTNLGFAQDNEGNYIASPYDVFLKKNALPRQPAKGETVAAYNQRLLKAVNKLSKPEFVSEKDGKFATHQQKFVFGKEELAGMKLFFRKGNSTQTGGNCASCHTAPHFSDFAFHNSGLTQNNYDALHGNGKFMQLSIPQLKERNKDYNAFLPATAKHPEASSRFRSIIRKDKPGVTDLGLWNVFANPDMPAPQDKLSNIMCTQARLAGNNNCSQAALLPATIAAFKTPVLRDLGHSAPYMHTGQFTSIKDSVSFYLNASSLAKAKQLRNTDPALMDMNITARDVDTLVAFVNALNEDYE